MYLLILFFPLFSFLISFLFGRNLGRSGSSFISTLCIFITAILSTIAFYEVSIAQSFCYLKFVPWLDCAFFLSNWGFQFDSLTVVMLVVVTYVSTLVHFYSIGYMSNDPHLQRFLANLSLFTFFMLLLVTSDNFLILFFGWEGIGLASFLLINFWSSRLQANKAAMKAIIVNRFGDFSLCFALFLIFFVFGAVDYSSIFASLPLFLSSSFSFLFFNFDFLTLICFFLFLAAVGKSAQLGLHTWLPDAMEGPTPVSALIHAATLV